MDGKYFHLVLVYLLAIVCSPKLIAQENVAGSTTVENTEIKMDDGTTVQAEAITLVVPEKRDNPGSQNLKLALVRFKSTAENPGPPVIYLAGGPGGSGTFVARVSSMQRLRQAGDLIFLDQRGTGRSSPRPIYRHDGKPEPGLFMDAERAAEAMKQLYKIAYDALTTEGFDLAGYNSAESADDIETLREALGYEKVSLLGFSYGTHLALATVKRHGERVHRVVLIGTEGLDHTMKLPSTYDMQIHKIAALASRDSDLAGWPGFVELMRQALGKLEREPVTVTVNDRRQKKDVDVQIGPFGLQLLLRLDIGDGNDIPVLPALMKSIVDGDYSLLQWFVQKRYNQFFSGRVNMMSFMTDAYSGASKERLTMIGSEMDGALLGDAVNMLDAESWQALGNPDLGPEYRAPFASDVEALFISGTLDSNTPPMNAEEVRRGFPFSHHIIIDHAGHEDMLPMRAVQDEIIRFFSTGKISGVRISRPSPDFLNVDAAKKNRGIGERN